MGTAAVLANLDKKDTAERQFVFEEGIGPVTVAVDGQTIRLRLRSPDYETTDEAPPAAAVAAALTLPEDAIIDSWYAGVGLRFCFVRLADPELVNRAVLDKAAWKVGIADGWSPHLYVFAGDYREGARLNARNFAPAVGVDEDPATGSACAALVASLAQRSPLHDCTHRLQIHQGSAMGRPSDLEGTACKKDGRLTEVTVGGHATIIGNGTITARPQ